MIPFKVLFVDDEEELADTLEERFLLRGFDAERALDGGRALRRLREKDFDIVVLDMMMPGLSGIETLKKIKEMRPETQVILLTGRGDERDCEAGLQLGAFDYIIKPINIDKLIDIMARALEGRA